MTSLLCTIPAALWEANRPGRVTSSSDSKNKEINVLRTEKEKEIERWRDDKSAHVHIEIVVHLPPYKLQQSPFLSTSDKLVGLEHGDAAQTENEIAEPPHFYQGREVPISVIF